jgi:chromate transporter
LREAVAVWARIALLSFGGPAGQIATMHRLLVEEKRWIGERRFLHALNFCMLLPGPEAQQLATYIGWLMHRTIGGIVAGGLFVLPGLIAIMALSWLYVLGSDLAIVEAAFFGLKAAVLAIVTQALIRIGNRSLSSPTMVAIAALSFVGIFFLDLPFPLIVGAALLFGVAGEVVGVKGLQLSPPGHALAGSSSIESEMVLGEDEPPHTRPTARWFAGVAAAFLALWIGPLAVIAIAAGPDSIFVEIGIFFSTLAVVTFGGAYAVLSYVAQAGVETFGWLTPEEMLDGLAMAETTPGPLIMVLQFVGFLAAMRESNGMPPLLAATLGSLLTTWVTFIPSFLLVFLGAPFVERLRKNRSLAAGLAAVTASVVGVVANLAVWFGLHTVFGDVRTVQSGPFSFDVPVLQTIDGAAVALSVAAVLAVIRLKIALIPLLAASASAGIALWVLAATPSG